MKIREERNLRVFLLTKLVQKTIHQIIPCYPKGRSSLSLSGSYTIVLLRPTLHVITASWESSCSLACPEFPFHPVIQNK